MAPEARINPAAAPAVGARKSRRRAGAGGGAPNWRRLAVTPGRPRVNSPRRWRDLARPSPAVTQSLACFLLRRDRNTFSRDNL